MKKLILLTMIILLFCSCSNEDSKMIEEKKTQIVTYDIKYYDGAKEMFDDSDLVIKGKIIDKSTQRIDISTNGTEEPQLYEVYSIEITKILKGDSSKGDIVHIKIPGGEDEKAKVIVKDAPTFAKNSNYIFFIVEYPNVPGSLVNYMQGYGKIISGENKAKNTTFEFNLEEVDKLSSE